MSEIQRSWHNNDQDELTKALLSYRELANFQLKHRGEDSANDDRYIATVIPRPEGYSITSRLKFGPDNNISSYYVHNENPILGEDKLQVALHIPQVDGNKQVELIARAVLERSDDELSQFTHIGSRVGADFHYNTIHPDGNVVERAIPKRDASEHTAKVIRYATRNLGIAAVTLAHRQVMQYANRLRSLE